MIGLMSAAVLVPSSAAGAAATELRVGELPLEGATVSTRATVSLVGADAASVSWVLDGTYLGRDGSAPFELALDTSAGEHRLKARSESATGVKLSYTVAFTAGTSATPTPTPTPTIKPSSTPSPAPSTTPTTTSNPTDPGNVRRIATSGELTGALATARPGQVLELADGIYSGKFLIESSGTASAPIVLRGSRGAVLDGGSIEEIGYTLYLLGANHWRLEGFSVRAGQKGVVLDRSSHNVLSRLEVSMVGMEAVHLRTGSSDNRVERSRIHDTGLFTPGFGEGVYLGSAKSNWLKYGSPDGSGDHSDRNAVIGNRIYATTGENIDIKEGTTGGVIAGNFLDGADLSGDNFADTWIDVKGNGYQIVGNTGVDSLANGFETHVILDGWGRGNVFRSNVLAVNSSGYGIKIAKPSDSANVVRCDNSATGAESGLSNLSCT